MAKLIDLVRPMVQRRASNIEIVAAAMRAGFSSHRSIVVTASKVRRELGREPVGKNGYGVSGRVNAYLADVATEYRLPVAEVRRRMLTAICDDDLAHAVLGDPPPKRKPGRSVTTEVA